MKKSYMISKLLIAPLLMLLAFSSCTKDNNAITIGITDLNGNITAVDKLIVAPGDVVTMTGIDLDKVFKIMLNSEGKPVTFVATSSTELKITIPATAPLGNVITVNIFFSGKGLAQRALAIQSPPVILAISPAAGQPGDKLTIVGRELYLATEVYFGDKKITDFVVVDDKTLTIIVPTGATGGTVKVLSATGSISLSPTDFVSGRELMINNFDGNKVYNSSTSNNGNIDVIKTEVGDFLRNNFITLPIVDKATSWGGNFDMYLTGLTAMIYTNAQISLSIDIKSSKNMNVSIMVQGVADVYGLTKVVTPTWQTIVIPFTSMGSGYGNNGPNPVEAISKLTAVKIQPPASASNANFGESVSFDNVKFIVKF